MRPAMYEAWMRSCRCAARDGAPATYDVVGPVCESGDWLGRDRALAVAAGRPARGAVGRRLLHEHGEQLQHRGRAPPKCWSTATTPWLIRERERVADLMRGEHLLPALSATADASPSALRSALPRPRGRRRGRALERAAAPAARRGSARWRAGSADGRRSRVGGFSGFGTSPCTGVRARPLMCDVGNRVEQHARVRVARSREQRRLVGELDDAARGTSRRPGR